MFTDVFESKEWEEYTKQTSNATATTIKQIRVPVSKTAQVQMEVVGQKSDVSAYGTWKVAGTFYRTSAGNVTQDGVTQSIYTETSAGCTADVSFAANTTAQTVDCKIAGVAAETWNWRIKVRYIYS